MHWVRRSLREPFTKWGRNAKVLVATEPLWSIPMSWIFFYRPMLMRSLGVSEVEIGLTITMYSVLQTFLPLLGGYLADRFGRKRVFMLFDVVGWTTSLIVWIMAQEFWQMILAMLFESLTTTIFPVWECILVEDTAPEDRASIYGSINLIYVSGSLLSPLAGLIVSTYGVERGCRMMFKLALATLVVMFVIRQMLLRETDVGRALIKERSEISGFKGYRMALQMVFRGRIMLPVFLCSVIGSFYYSVLGTYSSLYLTDPRGLALDEGLASLVPAASSATAILALTVLSFVRGEEGLIKVLATGYLLSAVSLTVLVAAPSGCLSLAVLSGALGGFYILVYPSVKTLLMNRIDLVDGKARAKVVSLHTTFSALVNWLTPIAGYGYIVNPKIPFLALISGLIVNVAVTLLIKRLIKRNRSASTF